MEFLVLFLGMAASGISGRVTLLSQRGGWFLEDQARKSPGMHVFDLVGLVAGLASFVVSFLIFDWWWPLIAIAVGYWLVAPILFNCGSYAFFYQTQFLTALVSLGCSVAIIAFYMEYW